MVVSMTQDEIIGMAKKCGWDNPATNMMPLYDFAKLVAQHEREQCKKLCEWKTGNQFVDEAVAVCYRAIDLRGQA
jgi:hypothetical protein